MFAKIIHSASRETVAFEMDVTEQVEGAEAWVGGQLNSSGHAISVAVMPQWTLQHIVFAYESFVKSGESFIETERLFRCRFNIGRHGNIPSRSTIVRWATSFRTRETIMKKKPPGPVATARTPENVERVREAIVRSPTRSARRHAVELGMSEGTVRRILHKMAHNRFVIINNFYTKN